MKRSKSFLAFGLALSMAATTAVPIYAEDEVIKSDGSQQIQVTADVSSSWQVTIPKSVNLTSDKKGTGTYTGSIPVTVIGDIAVNEIITVDTTDSIELEDAETNNSVLASIIKGETVFGFDDLTGGQTVNVNHTVVADLIPGNWSGNAEFSINLSVDKNYIGRINDYGFYFDVKYNATDPDSGSEYGIVLNKDGTADLYTDGFYTDTTEAEFSDKHIYLPNYGMEFDVNEDGTELNDGSLTYELDLGGESDENAHLYGLFDENDVQLASWEELVNDYNMTMYFRSSYDADGNRALYKIIENNPELHTSVKLVIKDGIPSIPYHSLHKLATIETIIIPDSVTYIGQRSLIQCKALKTLDIPDSVTNISEEAFYGCSSLESINIPDSVTYIGDEAFQYCDSLKTIDLPESITDLNKIFYGCTGLETFAIPDGVTVLDDYAFNDCDNLISLPYI